MKIPKLNIKKKRGRKKGSPLKDDPALVNSLSRLQTINDYETFETWRREFLKRLGYFLVDETIEQSEETYHVRLRVKVDKMVRIIAKIAQHVNNRNLSSTKLTIQARTSLNDVMKCCEDISTFLKVLSPLNAVEEKIVGFTKYNTASVLVETSFKEYERLNMCRDILQVLRENFVNLVAEPQHLAAFNKFEKEISAFKTVLLEDVGLLPVLKKQRQLKPPDPPRALIIEIRRGVLREALISKSTEAKQSAQACKNEQTATYSNPIIRKPKVDRIPKVRGQRHYSEIVPDPNMSSASEVINPDHSIVDTKEDHRRDSLKIQKRLENDVGLGKAKRSTKELTSKSPLKRRPKTISPRRSLQQSVNDIQKNRNLSPLKQQKKSNSPKRGLKKSHSKTMRSTSRKQGAKRDFINKDGGSKGLSRSDHTLRSRNTSTAFNKASKFAFKASEYKCREERGQISSDLYSTRQTTIREKAARQKPVRIVTPLQTIDPWKGNLSEDDRSTSSVHKKNMSKIKAKKARKRNQLMKNVVRERNVVATKRGLDALHKKEFNIPISPIFYERARIADLNRAQVGSMSTALLPNNIQDTFSGLNSNTKLNTLESLKNTNNERLQRKVMHRGKKKKIHPKSTKHKNNARATDDYKKIIHGRTSPSYSKHELPKLNMKWRYPVLVSNDVFLQEPSTGTRDNTVAPKFEKLQGKLGELFSSKILASLLDTYSSLSHDEDEQSTYYDTTSNPERNSLHIDNGKGKISHESLGNLCNKLASRSSDYDTFQKVSGGIKSIPFENKIKFEKQSFYDNFIKPLTKMKVDSIDKSAEKSFLQGIEQWEVLKDIFEDSVCSSKYTAGRLSMDEAIAKFNSEESIIELQRLMKTEEQKAAVTEIQHQRDKETESPLIAASKKGSTLNDGASNTVVSRKKRNSGGIKTRKHFDSKHEFIEASEEYTVYDQRKDVITVEEEVARMANEVAKLQSALEDNHHAFHCTEIDKEEAEVEINEEATYKLKGGDVDSEVAENIDKLHLNRYSLHGKDKEGNNTFDEGKTLLKSEDSLELESNEDKNVSLRSDFCHRDEGDGLESAMYQLKLGPSEDKLRNASTEYDKEMDKEQTDEEISECKTLFQELGMVEKMFELENDEGETQEEEALLLRQLTDPRFEASGGATGKSSNDTESLQQVALGQNGSKTIGYTRRGHYENRSSLRNTKGREKKSIVPSGVRVYDPSARF